MTKSSLSKPSSPKTSRAKPYYLLYIGSGRTRDLEQYIKNTDRPVILVDGNPDICNFLQYETRNAKHITVVNAVVSEATKAAKFKIFNMEEMSSLNDPHLLLESYPGLELVKEIAVETKTLSNLIKAYLPKKAVFDLIVDICGSEGEVFSKLFKGPNFERVRHLRISGSNVQLYKEAKPLEDIRQKIIETGLEANITIDDVREFVDLTAFIDTAHLERLALKKEISTLEGKAKASQKTISLLGKAKDEVVDQLKTAQNTILELESDLGERKLKFEALSKQHLTLSEQSAIMKSKVTESKKTHSALRKEIDDYRKNNAELSGIILKLKNELIASQGLNSDNLSQLQDKMKATYSTITDELNSQIYTLKSLVDSKSEAVEMLLQEQTRLNEAVKENNTVKGDLKKAEKEIKDLKSKLAEREASLKWQKQKREADKVEIMQELASQANTKTEVQSELPLPATSKSEGEYPQTEGPNTIESKFESEAKAEATVPTSYNEVNLIDYVKLKSVQPRTILIASVPRSGGTWIYNAVRGILEQLKIPYAKGWAPDFEPLEDVKYNVIKAHKSEEYEGATWKVVTNHRSLADRVASLIRMGWVEDTDEGIRNALRYQEDLYEYWSNLSDFEADFSQIRKAPHLLIENLGKALEVELSKAQIGGVFEFVNELKPIEGDAYDPVTLLHHGHVLKDRAEHNNRVARITNIMDEIRDEKDPENDLIKIQDKQP